MRLCSLLFAPFGVLSAGDPHGERSLAKFLNASDVNAKIDDLFVDLGTAESAGPTRERFLPNLGRRP